MIRLRLTLTYGVVFLITGAVVLTIGYLLVRHNIGRIHFQQGVTRLGLPPVLLRRSPGLGPSTFEIAIARDLHRQLVAGALHRLLTEYAGALGLMTMIAATG